jgi:hypothetical protein
MLCSVFLWKVIAALLKMTAAEPADTLEKATDGAIFF